MRRRTRWIVPLLLIALGWNAALALAALDRSTFLPIVFGQTVPATTCARTGTLIYNQDVGSLAVVRTSDGRYLIAAQNRQDGSRIHVLMHVGAGVQEVAAPAVTSVLTGTVSPQFSPPGPKQGSVAIVDDPFGGERIYYTQREEDETPNEGPYAVWCQSFG